MVLAGSLEWYICTLFGEFVCRLRDSMLYCCVLRYKPKSKQTFKFLFTVTAGQPSQCSQNWRFSAKWALLKVEMALKISNGAIGA